LLICEYDGLRSGAKTIMKIKDITRNRFIIFMVNLKRFLTVHKYTNVCLD